MLIAQNIGLGMLLVAGTILGCGGTTEKVKDPGLSSVNGSATESNAPAESTTIPPGKIEMPVGVDPASLPITPPADENPGKSGGIEMPKLESTSTTVISQRPVLDEAESEDKSQDGIAVDNGIKLTAAPWSTIEKVIAESGTICVVDLWSLSCDPCLKEFPGLVRLHHDLGDKVTCVSLNVDYDGRKTKPAEVYRPRVEAFLQSSKAKFGNYLCETANEELYAKLKIASIPAVLVYDANGTLVRTFTDTGKDLGFGYTDDVIPFVKSLVAQ